MSMPQQPVSICKQDAGALKRLTRLARACSWASSREARLIFRTADVSTYPSPQYAPPAADWRPRQRTRLAHLHALKHLYTLSTCKTLKHSKLVGTLRVPPLVHAHALASASYLECKT